MKAQLAQKSRLTTATAADDVACARAGSRQATFEEEQTTLLDLLDQLGRNDAPAAEPMKTSGDPTDSLLSQDFATKSVEQAVNSAAMIDLDGLTRLAANDFAHPPPVRGRRFGVLLGSIALVGLAAAFVVSIIALISPELYGSLGSLIVRDGALAYLDDLGVADGAFPGFILGAASAVVYLVISGAYNFVAGASENEVDNAIELVNKDINDGKQSPRSDDQQVYSDWNHSSRAA